MHALVYVFVRACVYVEACLCFFALSYVHACVCACVRVCVRVCVHLYVGLQTPTHELLFVCLCSFLREILCVSAYVRTSVFMCVRPCVYTCVFVFMCVCVSAFVMA